MAQTSGIIPYEKVSDLFFVASLFFYDLHVKEEAVIMESKRILESGGETEEGRIEQKRANNGSKGESQ